MMKLAEKRVTVLGLGRFGGGIAVAKWLCTQGAVVTVTDKDSADNLSESILRLSGLPITFRLGEEPTELFSKKQSDLIVTSPAVPPTSALLGEAAKNKVPVTTEICLFVERCATNLIVGVTGTKGKSTTTALLGKMLAHAKQPPAGEMTWHGLIEKDARGNLKHASARPAPPPPGVFVGGNIGVSLLDRLGEIKPTDIVVLELSSFMLWHLGKLKWSPRVALITMVDADHLEWHGTPAAYVEAKQNIVRFQTEKDFAVVSTDSKLSREFGKLTRGKVVEYGKRANLPAAFAPLLPGKHNRFNERGAYAVAKLFGVYPDEAEKTVADFVGLPHRLQLVHESAGVKWVNDSIATVPEAAAAACRAFPEKIVIQIVGGHNKGLDFTPMTETLAKRCKAVFTIGETAEKLAVAMGPIAKSVGTLQAAVDHARVLANPGDIVLLSPGCSSYDQFVNFEKRGEQFAKLAGE